MDILIIEDDNNKMRRIADEIYEISKTIKISEARSYQSGLRKLMTNRFHRLLLDMSLPIFDISGDEDGFQIDPFSGSNILTEMKRKSVIIPTKVITMFETFGDGQNIMTLDELDRDLKYRFENIYKGIIYYNSSEVDWKKKLRDFIEEKYD